MSNALVWLTFSPIEKTSERFFNLEPEKGVLDFAEAILYTQLFFAPVVSIIIKYFLLKNQILNKVLHISLSLSDLNLKLEGFNEQLFLLYGILIILFIFVIFSLGTLAFKILK